MSRSSIESPGHTGEKSGVSKLENVDSTFNDPDAGLSDEERAAIVKRISIIEKICHTNTGVGQEARSHARLQNHSLGTVPASDDIQWSLTSSE